MCRETLCDPRTLACLHSFCLACLESQKARTSPSSQLSCHQCRAPFTLASMIGVSALECNTFTDSLVKSAKENKGDVNRVIKCDFCDAEDAAMHCVECNEYFCPGCSKGHQKGKATAAHRQIPLEEALSGQTAIKRLPRCQKHFGFEVDSYCKTCNEAVCARCGIEKHPRHDFCPLSQVTGPLQDEIVGFAVTVGKKEQKAREAIDVMDKTIKQIEDRGTAAEREIVSFFISLHAELDARQAELISEISQVREASVRRKGEAETATVQFREFLSFTDGLLAQGTPLEIAGTHKMVRNNLHLFMEKPASNRV